jgi:uncharacterized protein YecE (DUF72 family)
VNVLVGTSGFQYPEWKGSFYPEDLPTSKMLPYYAERLGATEINYTFRRIPNRTTIANWVEATPDQFSFALKAPQRVTHFAKLKDCGDTLRYFTNVVTGLGPKLGPILFQLPPTFKQDLPLLDEFCQSLPSELQAAFEFRHASWFSDDTYSCLEKARAALCLADSEDRTPPRIITAPFGYLRLRRPDYTDADLADWAGFVKGSSDRWKSATVFFKHEEGGIGAAWAQQFSKLVN